MATSLTSRYVFSKLQQPVSTHYSLFTLTFRSATELFQDYKNCLEDAIIEAQNYNICIPSKRLLQYNHELLQSLPEIKEQKQELIKKEFKCAKEINDQCTGNNRIEFSLNKCEFDEHTHRFHNFSKNVKIEVTIPDKERGR